MTQDDVNEGSTLIRRKIDSKASEKNESELTEKPAEVETTRRCHKRPESKLSSYRIWTRVIIIGAVLIIGYFTSNKDKERKFAMRRETIIFRSQDLTCSPDYAKEVRDFKDCMPEKCGRFVSDSLVGHQDAVKLLDIATRGLNFGGSDGGVSILDLHSGALSKGDAFINIYTLPEAKGFLQQDLLQIYKVIKQKIMKSISDKFHIGMASLHLTHPTFFSRITNATAKTVHDEYWHAHVDKETYSSFHYTSLIYLNDYQRDFQGGRFLFIDKNVAENQTTHSIIEPKKGRTSVFTSGGENMHKIEVVTSGTRYALTISFTCNRKYAIADPMEQS